MDLYYCYLNRHFLITIGKNFCFHQHQETGGMTSININFNTNLTIYRENQVKFIKWAEKQLNIKNFEDWYTVGYMDIIKIGNY